MNQYKIDKEPIGKAVECDGYRYEVKKLLIQPSPYGGNNKLYLLASEGGHSVWAKRSEFEILDFPKHCTVCKSADHHVSFTTLPDGNICDDCL